MKFRFRYKKLGCIQMFLSGLITAIAINYLVVGFIDIILNIDSLLQWLEQSGAWKYINALFGSR